MKKLILLLIAITAIASFTLTAQVAINNDGSNPDNSAILDLKSTNSGLLLPRMNTSQISYISNPAAGLMVFNTDSSDFYGFNGNEWISVWNTDDTITVWFYGDPITDSRDGQSYNTVQIGNQCWLQENLISTKYNDGTNIPNVTNNSTWDTLTTPAYCWYDNDSTSYAGTYGALYNWYAVGTAILCPTGWHIPTDDEWKTMEMYLGLTQEEADEIGWRGVDEGGKLKEAGTTHWNSPNLGATDSSGFTALPGGYRYTGIFQNLGNNCDLWSATAGGSSTAWYRTLHYNLVKVNRYHLTKRLGFSVRCIKD